MYFFLNRVEYGKNLNVYDGMYLTIARDASLKVGDNFTISSGDGINPISRNIKAKIFIAKGARITIGNNTGLSSPCLRAKESITIGNNVNIGADCIIIDTDAHNLDWRIRNGGMINPDNPVSETETAVSKPIVIEDDVLIGTRCIILKGVTIGARSIIGAGSVVTKSIPADCIAGGNPCRVIKYLTDKA